jgi:hypothetical protein
MLDRMSLACQVIVVLGYSGAIWRLPWKKIRGHKKIRVKPTQTVVETALESSSEKPSEVYLF